MGGVIRGGRLPAREGPGPGALLGEQLYGDHEPEVGEFFMRRGSSEGEPSTHWSVGTARPSGNVTELEHEGSQAHRGTATGTELSSRLLTKFERPSPH